MELWVQIKNIIKVSQMKTRIVLVKNSTYAGHSEGFKIISPQRNITQWIMLPFLFVLLFHQGRYALRAMQNIAPSLQDTSNSRITDFGPVFNSRSMENIETLSYDVLNSTAATGRKIKAITSSSSSEYFMANMSSSQLFHGESDRILPPHDHQSFTSSVTRSGRGGTVITSMSSPSSNLVATTTETIVQNVSTSLRVRKPTNRVPTKSTKYPITVNETMSVGLHVVVSHCTLPINWIWERALVGERWKSFTIYSKCGVHLPRDSLPRDAKVVILPNVGRCDHSYAYWIAQTLASIQVAKQDVLAGNIDEDDCIFQPQDHVMFVKDNDNSYRNFEERIPWNEMKEKMMLEGFSCENRIKRPYSDMTMKQALNVAVRSTLAGFTVPEYNRPGSQKVADASTPQYEFKSNFTSLEGWYRSLPITLKLGSRAPLLPNAAVFHQSKALASNNRKSIFTPHSKYFVPICYGGYFMASIERIMLAPVDDWNPIVESLSRGDNIEEGHFMERIWASLLSRPMTIEEELDILDQDYNIIRNLRHPFAGLVLIEKWRE
jgi:hypothetical protein